MIITQDKFLTILKTLTLKAIRSQMGRIRLKFTLEDLAFYLHQLHLHQACKVTFKSLWLKSGRELSYQSFCQNIDACSKLAPLMLIQYNKLAHIKASSLFNVVDTSLIPTKQEQHISKSDFEHNKVTIRSVSDRKKFICGLKFLVLINRQGLIIKANVLSINTPDIDVTKNPYQYGLPPGILLADKGFNSHMVQQRLKNCGIRLLSPYKTNQKQQLSEKERKLYKKRWSIETLFQTLKHDYGPHKLPTSSKYTLNKQKAVLILCALSYNLQSS